MLLAALAAAALAPAAQPPSYPVLLPKWPVSYAMADSTIAMASNSKTFFNVSAPHSPSPRRQGRGGCPC